jgi:hypothetical protein
MIVEVIAGMIRVTLPGPRTIHIVLRLGLNSTPRVVYRLYIDFRKAITITKSQTAFHLITFYFDTANESYRIIFLSA